MTEWTIKDEQGNALTKKSDGYEEAFHDGYAVAENENNEFNYVDKQKNVLSDENFKQAEDFSNGISRVRMTDGLYRFYKSDNTYLTDKSYKGIAVFSPEGISRVWNEDGTFNFVSENGKTLSDEDYEQATPYENGYCKVLKSGKWYPRDTEGNLIGSGYSWVGAYEFGYFPVQVNEDGDEENPVTPLFNFMNTSGELFNDEEYEEVTSFNAYGIAMVKKGGLWYCLKETDKTYLTDDGFLLAMTFFEGQAVVRTTDGTFNLLEEEDGKLLLSEGVRQMHPSILGIRRVFNQDWQVNYLNTEDGSYLLPEWAEKGYDFDLGAQTALVSISGQWYDLATDGTKEENEDYEEEEEEAATITIEEEEEESNG